jgi:anti-sigma factor RsiW
MNCRRFQNRLYEYVEGSLSSRTQAAADKHLAQCPACRRAVHQEQQVSLRLSDRFRQDTETLALRPEVRHRILTALDHKSAPPTEGESIVGLWRRLVWPLAGAVILLLIVAFLLLNYFSGSRVPDAETARSNGHDNRSTVSIQVSYCVPTYKFRQEGNLVVDTLTCEPVVASGTLWVGSEELGPKNQERKMLL